MNVKRGLGEEVGGERRREERRSHLILEMCNLQRIERTERTNDKKEDIRQGVQKVAGIEGKGSRNIYRHLHHRKQEQEQGSCYGGVGGELQQH